MIQQADPYMAVETTRELFQTLHDSGIDVDKLARLAKIDKDALAKSEMRFPVAKHLQLWQAGESLSSLDAIGLRMGARSNPHNRGIVGLVFSASHNLEAAVENKVQYTKILADHIHLHWEKDNDEFSMCYSILDGFFHPYEIERVFAGFYNWVKTYLNKKIFPTRVCLQFAKPAHARFYEHHFQCPVFFDQPQNVIAFSSDLLGHVNPAFNDYLYQILKARADAVLEKLDNRIDFVNGVKSMIAGRLCHGNFQVEEIAASLNMSKRTLHRKLTDENTTYQQLLDDVRQEMALSYLEKGQCNITNIPFLLGYSDARGFNRAFKRWTGTSPSQFLQPEPVPHNLEYCLG